MKAIKNVHACIFSFCLLPCLSTVGQPVEGINKIESTVETIIEYDFRGDDEGSSYKKPIGMVGDTILYVHETEDNDIRFYLFGEQKHTFKQIYETWKAGERNLYPFYSKDSLLFYIESLFTTPTREDDGYNELIFWHNNQTIRIDSIYNADKNIRASFSTDGKYLLVNTLSELTDYYQPEIDDQIIVYSVDSLKKGVVKQQSIPCKLCADSYLIGDQLFFTKSNVPDDLWDGYAWPDIYVAPWGRIQDSVKIAAAADIYAISPDGRYIVAKRRDLPNGPRAIINVATKKYQLLLGRNYQEAQVFYSYQKKKFAFDFGDQIVYVDFPEEYPFDALNRENPEVPFSLDLKPFQHPPFSK